MGTAVDELHQARMSVSLSQQDLAGATGIPRTKIGRIERGEVVEPRAGDLGAIAGALGLSLRLNLYPDGEPVHDRVQLRLLAAFRTRIDPSLAWRTEVALPIDGDRRAWDAVAIAPDGWTGVEAISVIGGVDGTLRRVNLKRRDDPRVARVVLLVADTTRNRHALRLAAAAIRVVYPLDTRATMAALAAGRPPPLNGVVLLRVPREPP
jgi:transcriptional regulator with XRE-family HTH domain